MEKENSKVLETVRNRVKLYEVIEVDELLLEKAQDIVDYWNTFDGFPRSKGTENVLKQICRRISKCESDTIKLAISNYHTVLNDKRYFFNYKWTVQDFISQLKYEKFISDGSAWIAYVDKIKLQDKVKPSLEISGYDSMLKLFKTMNYSEYLETDHWKHFAEEALIWSNHKCQLCDDDKNKLCVHHKTYKNRGRETFNDIIVLCDKCHAMVHGK